jgi:hypothetical protein
MRSAPTALLAVGDASKLATLPAFEDAAPVVAGVKAFITAPEPWDDLSSTLVSSSLTGVLHAAKAATRAIKIHLLIVFSN